MSDQDLGTQIEAQFNDVVRRLQSKQLFQSNWDIATFAIFFIFIGAVLTLILLVLIRCCWGFCCSSSPRKKHGKQKVGVDNLALEP
ncbi:small integral membrane protein 22 [Chiloscyllium plagiosum]|uniref:small integral membrane protein 22 n=1 Tax=Chiloscyllium plagiosum TaxID=36176 RepID=UPI001CB844CA|nr:small integral membrane protein 22 [Chiloscyllium plagiosum]XP_043567974.1 small integral membrane protein 22 [Chiloscyllium plagiosum]